MNDAADNVTRARMEPDTLRTESAKVQRARFLIGLLKDCKAVPGRDDFLRELAILTETEGETTVVNQLELLGSVVAAFKEKRPLPSKKPPIGQDAGVEGGGGVSFHARKTSTTAEDIPSKQVGVRSPTTNEIELAHQHPAVISNHIPTNDVESFQTKVAELPGQSARLVRFLDQQR